MLSHTSACDLMDFRWSQVRSLRNRDGDGCCWCGMLLRYPTGAERRRKAGVVGDDDVTIEHLIPVAEGGTDAESNLLLAHYICNQERGTEDREPLWRPPPPEEGLALDQDEGPSAMAVALMEALNR